MDPDQIEELRAQLDDHDKVKIMGGDGQELSVDDVYQEEGIIIIQTSE